MQTLIYNNLNILQHELVLINLFYAHAKVYIPRVLLIMLTFNKPWFWGSVIHGHGRFDIIMIYLTILSPYKYN